MHTSIASQLDMHKGALYYPARRMWIKGVADGDDTECMFACLRRRVLSCKLWLRLVASRPCHGRHDRGVRSPDTSSCISSPPSHPQSPSTLRRCAPIRVWNLASPPQRALTCPARHHRPRHHHCLRSLRCLRTHLLHHLCRPQCHRRLSSPRHRDSASFAPSTILPTQSLPRKVRVRKFPIHGSRFMCSLG